MAETLFLAHRLPFPPDRGDRIRSYHVLEHIARLGRVHLGCFVDDEADAAHLPELRARLGGRLGEVLIEHRRSGRLEAAAIALRSGQPLSVALYASSALQRFVRSRLSDPRVSAVYAFSGQMAQFVPEHLRQRFIMDFVDVDSAKFATYAKEGRGPMALVHAREARRLAAYEGQVGARADASLFVSDAEAALFRSSTGLPQVHTLPMGTDFTAFDPAADFPRLPPALAPMLLFTGQMDYRPNIDAVTWFVLEVLPHLPDAHFVIAGRAPTAAVKALASDRVTVTGPVADMRSWLAAADVVVAPLRIARGVQNKVLEAMAMARPVVASSAAFEGIEAEPGRHLVIADSAQAVAGAIKALLTDKVRARDLGTCARAHVVRHYCWDARLAPLGEMLYPDSERAAA